MKYFVKTNDCIYNNGQGFDNYEDAKECLDLVLRYCTLLAVIISNKKD